MNENVKNAIWVSFVIVLSVVILSVLMFSKDDDQAITIRMKKVAIKTQDDVRLVADLFEPKFEIPEGQLGFPGVVLLGPFNETRKMYDILASDLCAKGTVVLSVDVRGSGESIQGKLKPEQISNIHLDAEAALDYLSKQPNVDNKKLGILGTVLTARSALLGAQSNKNVRAGVLVSAYLDSTGLDLVRNSPDLPILVVVSFQDALAGSQAKEIYDSSTNEKSHIEVYMNAGEGSQIWFSHVTFEMAKFITDWLWKQFSEVT